MPIISVITPAASYNIASLSNIKLVMGISGTEQDTLLTLLLNMANSAIQNYTKRVFASEVINEKLPGTGTRNLVLSRFPVTNIAFVKQNNVTLDATSYELTDANAAIILNKNSVWTFDGYGQGTTFDIPTLGTSRNNYEVQYTAGYATIPADLEMAAISYVRYLFNARQRDTSISQEAVSGVYSVTYGKEASGFPSDVLNVLDKYRNYAL